MKLSELRRKKKEAESLLFSDKINKEQYNNILEILKVIQFEERDIEEKTHFSLNKSVDLNNIAPLNENFNSLEKILSILKENFIRIISEGKLVKRKLKEEKIVAQKEFEEKKQRFQKVEEFYQGEFEKLIKKVEEIQVKNHLFFLEFDEKKLNFS